MRALFIFFAFFFSISISKAQFAGRGFMSDTIHGEFDKLHNTVWVFDENKLYIASSSEANVWHVAEYSAALGEHTLFVDKFITAFIENSNERIPVKKTDKYWKSLKEIKFILSPEKNGYLLSHEGSTLHLHSYNDIIKPYNTGASMALRNVITGKPVGEAHSNIQKIHNFSSSGIAIFKTTDNQLGLINVEGKIVAQPEYLDIENNLSGNSFRFVKKVSDVPSTIRYQDEEKNFYKYRAPYTLKTGYFKADGSMLLPMLFDHINPPNKHGIIFAVNEEELYAFHTDGRALPRTPAARIQIGEHIMLGAHGKRNGIASFYSVDGSLLNDTVYYRIEPFEKNLGFKYLRVYYNGKVGIYNEYGKQLFPLIAENIDYSYGFFAATIDGQAKFMRADGKNVFDKEFEKVNAFVQSKESHKIYSCVKVNGKYGVIDTAGNWLLPGVFDEPLNFYRSDRQIAKKNGKYGVIELNGNEVVPFRYEGIRIEPNLSYFAFMQNNRWGTAELSTGKVITPPRFEIMSLDLKEGFIGIKTFTVKEDGKVQESPYSAKETYKMGRAGDPGEGPYNSRDSKPKSYLKALLVPPIYFQGL